MRRAWRYILGGLTVLSLLLCAGACALWVRSYRVADSVLWWADGPPDAGGRRVQRGVRSAGGGLGFGSATIPAGYGDVLDWFDGAAGPGFSWRRRPVAAVPEPASGWERLGFRSDAGAGGVYSGFIDPARTCEWGSATVPWWAVAVTFAAVGCPGAVGWWRRRRRADAGLCPACGYDLRATPDRCPECGRVPDVVA